MRICSVRAAGGGSPARPLTLAWDRRPNYCCLVAGGFGAAGAGAAGGLGGDAGAALPEGAGGAFGAGGGALMAAALLSYSSTISLVISMLGDA